ncbi:glucose-1-phosphate thymidylyltransferase RfbA [Agarivorans sp. JK6]|uniref:glucose-1-phosphate thymidylyltransferase RfbA n=1 Tax=Agarivorans sp. JK6 TaxID=2997426 RepID=UPI003873BBCD
MRRKGIVLAGGSGTRLYPITQVISKQLMPVYDKPMIYYPIATLMLAGITDILIISTPEDLPRFKKLLGNGTQWGLRFEYAEQNTPDGIAQALLIAETFLDNCAACLVLGDNLFYGQGLPLALSSAAKQCTGACVFGYHVTDAERYGVVEFDKDGKVLSIEEKPEVPKSSFAVTGCYFFDNQVVDLAKQLKPSKRGELEITDLINLYLDKGLLQVQLLGRGSAWLDTGTHDSLLEAAQFIAVLEKRQGLKVCCPEEIAYRLGLINVQQLKALAAPMLNNAYGKYLNALVS